MYMIRFIFIFAGLLLSCHCYPQYELSIKINGLRSNDGKIMLEVFDEKETVIAREICEIKDRKCSISIKNLKPGRYAVRYYHDENLNQKMESNIFGKPEEGYGFSNNVTWKFGPPPFNKWLFELNENKTIELIPTY